MNNSTKSLLLHYKNSDLDQYGLTLNMVEKAIDNIGFQSNDLFRFTFGSDDPKSKSILTWLLNRFIPQDILSIQIRNSEPAKRAFLDKGTRLDILSRVTDSSNTEHDVNIEIQNYGTTLENTERSQFYVAKQIVDLNPEGSYNLSSIQAVHIMICNKLDLFSEIDEFYHEYIYIEKDRHEELPGYLSRIIYIETEKLKPLAQTKPIEEWTDLEKLGFILRYSQTKEMHDIIQLLIRENEVFQRMQEKRDEFFMSTIDSLNAIKRYYDELEDKRQLEYARTKALEEGRAEGLWEGRLEGIQLEKIRMIQSMYQKQLPLELISECVEISVEEIKQILDNAE